MTILPDLAARDRTFATDRKRPMAEFDDWFAALSLAALASASASAMQWYGTSAAKNLPFDHQNDLVAMAILGEHFAILPFHPNLVSRGAVPGHAGDVVELDNSFPEASYPPTPSSSTSVEAGLVLTRSTVASRKPPACTVLDRQHTPYCC